LEHDRVLLAIKLVIESDEPGDLNGLDLVGLFKDAEQCGHSDHCAVCEIAKVSQDGPELEEHHIAGKIRGEPNFPDTITVCLRCHEHLSDHQKDWLVDRNDPAVHLSSYLYGWADIFDLLYHKSDRPGFLRLARKFRSQGWHIRNKIKGR